MRELDPEKVHEWKVLALACIDGRFEERIMEYLDSKTGGIFDFRTEVGASKAIIDSEIDRDRFFNVVKTAVDLHHIKELWLFDHIDCGAYGGSVEHVDAVCEREFHLEKMAEASAIIAKKFPGLEVKNFYVDFDAIYEV